MMEISKWFILLFLTLKTRETHSAFGSCFSCGASEVKIRIFPEKPECYNPLYLMGKYNSYKLAVPTKIEDELKTTVKKGDDRREKEDYSDVIVAFDNKNLIFACPDGSDKPENLWLLNRADVVVSQNGDAVTKCCKNKIEPFVKNLNKICHTNDKESFTEYEIGFYVYMEYSLISKILLLFPNFKQRLENTWHPVYTVCYNRGTRTTLYSAHKLHGVAQGLKSFRYSGSFREHKEPIQLSTQNQQPPTDDRPASSGRKRKNSYSDDEDAPSSSKKKRNSAGSNKAMMDVYSKRNVRQLFDDMFKTRNKFADEGDKKYLAKGHLTPDADMVFVPLKSATYFFINAVPMWQEINNSSWKSIENAARTAAKLLKRDLMIHTGTYDVLKYYKKSIYLEGEGTTTLPVPAYLWKVIYDKETKAAIALIVANDPYIELKVLVRDFNDKFGENICQKYNWIWNDSYDDRIHCCEVSKLKDTVLYAPKLEGVKVLKFPDKNKNSQFVTQNIT